SRQARCEGDSHTPGCTEQVWEGKRRFSAISAARVNLREAAMNATRHDVAIFHPTIAVIRPLMFTLIFFASGITHLTTLHGPLPEGSLPSSKSDRLLGPAAGVISRARSPFGEPQDRIGRCGLPSPTDC